MLNLKANLISKTFDISPINNKIIQGEHNCIKAKITMDRYFGEIDLSKMNFYIHAITNPNSVSLPNQKLEANYSDNFIELIWVISKDFTYTAGEITAIIDGISSDGEQVIKLFSAPLNIIKDPACKEFSPSLGAFQTLLEEVTPLKKSCLESANSAKSSSMMANTYYNKTAAIVAKTPYISEDGFWMVWNYNINNFEKTAVKAIGERGIDGSDGKSAYQYATKSGYTKSETEFTSDLSNVSNKADVSLFDVVQPKTFTGNHLTIKHGLPLVIDSLVIKGKTTEKGAGEKSPNNPYIITGNTPTKLTVGNSIYILHKDLELYSLPNGVCDEYDVISGKLVKKINKIVINGTENWYFNGSRTAFIHFDIPKGVINKSENQNIVSTYFPSSSYIFEINPAKIDYAISYGLETPPTADRIAIRFKDFTTETEFKNWLSTHPTTILYELQVPQIINLNPQSIINYDDYTNIFFNNNTKFEINYCQSINKIVQLLNANK